ncbi:MAG TPA: hypothetical protein PLI43_03850 [Albidovulum sp.]|uniref:hypothetical protein n=1 Tax=Albidovulum sp. TaxID=1872424 RepID=UPI002D19195C|nr:hypothetical protein [Albidovulum sp.]
MKRFEYDILFFEIKKRGDYDTMRRILNEHGARGWEVISAEAGDYGYTAFLKRETPASSEGLGA